MQKNGALLTVACVLLLFAFNCTFPLQRVTSTPKKHIYANQSIKCRNVLDNVDLPDKDKTLADDLEELISKFKKNTNHKEKSRLGFRRLASKNFLNEDDLRHYEQLVIMKKYPFLDIKELEMKFSPSNKDRRDNENFRSRVNMVPEPSICEPGDDLINVEISNRGLSGFAIPTQLVKHISTTEKKLISTTETPKLKSENSHKFSKKSTEKNILKKLKDDVNQFLDKKKKN
ncbi:PREDICTED: uncharacterized protein LOC106122319 [Papilio xuthus]|uniref:Uncharacterized protein LOC106122319 n=1 Tax=Papilio xuthus TaxID=66420 RepID=A0AAJ6ZJE9_PAPXU|nr:PREDICTED: uncharacterized protein LOC106122319 [Papilio xuthus]